LYILQASRRRLAGIIRGYLRGERWATEKRIRSEVLKSHSVRELREVLSSPEFRHLRTINPGRMRCLRATFLKEHRPSYLVPPERTCSPYIIRNR
jgi:hypothetical protein